MGVRVIDISNHQSGMDVEAVVRKNDVAAVFILTNDGTFTNSFFHAQADAAERGGAVVVPYVYLRPNWAQTIDIHMNVVGSRYKQSLVDVEDGSGGWNECWNAHQRLWTAGRETPLLYWPRYHWQTQGSPDLTPLKSKVKGHWKSWYPDTVARGFDSGLALVPGYVWDDNRGGIPTRIVQFTGTGRLNGYSGNLDLNFFPGSRDELTALLGLSRPRPRAKGDSMFIVNVDTGEYAILSGGVLTGVNPDNARASRDKWGIPETGVNSGEWVNMQEKSAAIEQAGVRADQTQALLRELIATVKQIPGGTGGVVGAGDVSRIATATAELIDKRARDGNPDTGPAS